MIEDFGPEPTSVADLVCTLDDHGLNYTAHVVCTDGSESMATQQLPGVVIVCSAVDARDLDDDDIHSLADDIERQARNALPKTIPDPEFDLFNSHVVNWLMQHRRMAAIKSHEAGHQK